MSTSVIEGWDSAVHPAANLFPMMSDEDIDALAKSIREQGLRQPIIITEDGELLDGRNRVAACSRAGIPPRHEVFHGDDPVAFVMALNMDRRHLTTGQKAMLALKIEPMYEAEGLARMAAAGRSAAPGKPQKGVAGLPHLSEPRAPLARDKAGAAVQVSGRAVQQAKRVADAAPDLTEQVQAGTLALDRAERIVRDRQAAARRAAEAVAQQQHIKIGTRVDIRHGDFRQVLSDLSGVDAIITDPPYPREYLPLLDDLAQWADDVLAPDGVLAVLFGQTYLPEVYERLSRGRPYRWTGCYLTPGPAYSSMARHVHSNWKPVLVYGRGERFGDVVRAEGTDAGAKNLHHWGQDYGAFHQLVERLTKPGQVVVDPFMGSGTTLMAAKALGRHAIGCDIDLSHVETSRKRLGA